jgi:antitoxin MazE
MQVGVQKWGNSLAVRIPKPLAKDASVTEGTVLNLTVSEGIATPLLRKKLTLDRLLAKVTKKNRHAEIDTGKPVDARLGNGAALCSRSWRRHLDYVHSSSRP